MEYARATNQSADSDILYKVFYQTDLIQNEIQEQYLEDDIPWVVGFSGGKDSTAVLQLIFIALSKLPVSKLNKAVHVLSNDTLVENPNVVRFLDEQLNKIETIGKKKLFSHNPNLFHVFKSIPKLEDTFWLNLIGKGYPSPNRWFRWCTERLKIKPTSDYIVETVNKHGQAIIILGTRKAESRNRAASIAQYEIPGMRLRKYTIPNSYVYAPIVEMSNQDVWTYLINTSNPWNGDNKELLKLYKSAVDMTECPFVIDDTMPSCGNSRFGCWVCTVVNKDWSLSNMIVNGEEWMLPLTEFRDFLHEIRDDDTRREKRRRTGQLGPGPFTIDTRKEILEKLLMIEEEVKIQIITQQELAAIQYQWNYDGKFNYQVSEIFEKIKGKKTMIPKDKIFERRREELNILKNVCDEHNTNPNHIKELMELERENLTFLRRPSIFEEMKRKIERFVEENSGTHQL